MEHVWQIILSIISAAITGAVGYVWGRLLSHEVRIAKLETRVDGELIHIAQDLAEIKKAIERLRERFEGSL